MSSLALHSHTQLRTVAPSRIQSRLVAPNRARTSTITATFSVSVAVQQPSAVAVLGHVKAISRLTFQPREITNSMI
ncbi:hypothetical protein CDL15_Pgr019392 [Punica granatum]|uniref:Uncharacterized protein n=1 Tax=Punica granatum TaxID=22663 RepID=A0A218XSL5_PUNGR|nr:hypothetical protein CDL15_Pgr019392 [Punica granatum]PKI71877.1 hypothetical protein CRG98_007736 [Punica granatum]